MLELFTYGYNEIEQKHPKEWPSNRLAVRRLVDYYGLCVTQYFRTAKNCGYFLHTQPVHGDFHINNLLFSSSGKVTALLDFDDTKIDNPIQDIARIAASLAVFDFFNSPNNPLRNIPTDVDLALLRYIMGLYFHGRPIQKDLLNTFIPTLKCISLQMGFIGILSGSLGLDKINELMLLPQMLEDRLGDLS